MDVSYLIDALADPAAYPHYVGAVEVRQTHISAVFLAGDFVYKVKKPVAPGFLDFTTLEKRFHFCQEEVRLNRRLAPDVYLGVVPIAQTPNGLRLEADGEVIEWAVKMRRLPDDATLLERLRRGEVDTGLIDQLARRVAEFHQSADTNERVAGFGRFDAVAGNVRDVFTRAEPHVAGAVTKDVFERTRALMEDTLSRLRPLIEARAVRGVPRDCHGDLHLDHVYCFPDRSPPSDLVVIDCIEFSEQFRAGDPVADAAFAVMDLIFHGRRDLADTFADSYFRATGDHEGRALLPLYTAYRAAVRGMVDGLLLAEKEVPATEREAAVGRARGHWLLALTELEAPDRRPGLVLVIGLPGAGKSTLARELTSLAGFEVIRSDVVRKELAGLPANELSPAHAREALYAPEVSERTYTECLSRAERLLGEGRRVIVDATFREQRQRARFWELAVRCGVPFAALVCTVSPETARRRLDARKGDASDADWGTHQRLAGSWEAAGADVGRALFPVPMEETAAGVARARAALRQVGLMGG